MSRTWARRTCAGRRRARSSVSSRPTRVESAPVGKAVYTLLCRPSGGVVDDCIFYKRGDDEFFVIVNASNQSKDLDWFREHASVDCDVDDVSDQTALIAVQGPKAVAMVDRLPGDKSGTLSAMPAITFTDAEIAGVTCFVARTGYTGEDGFELACSNNDAVEAVGRAARSGRRRSAGCRSASAHATRCASKSKLPLYGNDLDDDHTPLEAGLGWAVKLDKGDFLGRDALLAQKASGIERQLVGFTIDESLRAIARHGYAVMDGGATVGVVTSGGPGISVGGAIGLAYVPTASRRLVRSSRSIVAASPSRRRWSRASSTSERSV